MISYSVLTTHTSVQIQNPDQYIDQEINSTREMSHDKFAHFFDGPV